MAGGSSAKAFFTGPIVLHPAEALDAFVRMAGEKTEFVYAEAPEEPREADCWGRAGDLARQGLVRTHQRRRAGGGWQFFLVRTAKPLPRDKSPQEKVLADRAASLIYTELKRAARMELRCPSDEQLRDRAGLHTRAQAQRRVRELIRVELISSTVAYENGVPSRVITVCDSKHAGAAAGAMTALPPKWAALQRAVAKDAAEVRS